MQTIVLIRRESTQDQFSDWGRFLSKRGVHFEPSVEGMYPNGRLHRSITIRTPQSIESVAELVCDALFVEPPVHFSVANEVVIHLQSKENKTPIAYARMVLRDRHGNPLGGRMMTDSQGKQTISAPPGQLAAELSISPVPGHWGAHTWIDFTASEQTVQCERLPFFQERHGWWHERMGIAQSDDSHGRGVKIGVIDTGCGPHPTLHHVRHVGRWNGGRYTEPSPDEPGWDESIHGTFVCGLITSRFDEDAEALEGEQVGYSGMAPGAEVVSACTVGEFGVPHQGDFVNAIDWLVEEEGVDLINLSWTGNYAGFNGLTTVIEDAFSAGTLCIAAAGNKGGEVLWPARFEKVIGVSAIGQLNSVPEESCHHQCLDDVRTGEGGVCFARFSCHGVGINCCAPGVGVISCIPTGGYGLPDIGWAAMDGTSMAAPIVTGTLGAMLSEDPGFAAKVGRSRSEHAVELLERNSLDCGLEPDLQGVGVLQFSSKA